MALSKTHVVLIPSYNPGPVVVDVVRAALAEWQPVWVIDDGSTDGSLEPLQDLARAEPNFRVETMAENSGKGAAILHGIRVAHNAGFTHVLTMDADGQHDTKSIPAFMETSQSNLRALVLGLPQFNDSAPALRVHGRKISNWWANLETLWSGIGDSLFGMRVYPVGDLRHTMETTRWMRRFDFDPEAAVRLVWRGLQPINVPSPVRYFDMSKGGVSHFNYLRDNLLLTGMHSRLLFGFLARLPMLVARKFRRRP